MSEYNFELPSDPEEVTSVQNYYEIDDMTWQRRADLALSSHVPDELVDNSLFPYYAEDLPAPIPTIAEIVAAASNDDKRTVIRMGPYMVKVGHIEVGQEAENMLFLEKNSDVRTAKVYAAFMTTKGNPFGGLTDEDDCIQFYLISEFLDGITLDEFASARLGKLCEDDDDSPSDNDNPSDNLNRKYPRKHKDWDSILDEKTTLKIGELAAEQFRKLRRVPPPADGRFGRVHGGELPIRVKQFVIPVPGSAAKEYGPWNYEECVTRLIHTSKVSKLCQGLKITPMMRTMFKDAKATLLDNARPSDRAPVLGHNDLEGCNIMVVPERDDASGDPIGIKEVVIIDWEAMCWIPSWFEAAKVLQDAEINGYVGNTIYEGLFEGMLDTNANIAMTLFYYYGLRNDCFK